MFDIITDSACDLTPETAARLNVEVIPFYVSLDGEHYRKEGTEIAVRDFYQFMVDNPSAYPKNQPAFAGRLRDGVPRPCRGGPPGALPLLHQQNERLRGQRPQCP